MEKRRKRKRGRFLSFVLAFFLAAVPIPASAVTGAVPRSLAGRSGDFLIRARPVGEDPAEGGALSVEILPQADGVPEGASFFFSVGLLDAPDALYELTAAGGFAPGAGVKIWRLAGGEWEEFPAETLVVGAEDGSSLPGVRFTAALPGVFALAPDQPARAETGREVFWGALDAPGVAVSDAGGYFRERGGTAGDFAGTRGHGSRRRVRRL